MHSRPVFNGLVHLKMKTLTFFSETQKEMRVCASVIYTTKMDGDLYCQPPKQKKFMYKVIKSMRQIFQPRLFGKYMTPPTFLQNLPSLRLIFVHSTMLEAQNNFTIEHDL